MDRRVGRVIRPAIALVLLLVPTGCGAAGAALGGAALGTAGILGSRALDGAERAAEVADDYVTEGVAWRRELRVEMKAAVREKCGALRGEEAIECWHDYYPTIEQLKAGIFGRPLEAVDADE